MNQNNKNIERQRRKVSTNELISKSFENSLGFK